MAELTRVEAVAVATIVCPRCEARAGERCTALSESGGTPQPTPRPHETRLLAVRAGYAIGWMDRHCEADYNGVTLDLLDSIETAGREA